MMMGRHFVKPNLLHVSNEGDLEAFKPRNLRRMYFCDCLLLMEQIHVVKKMWAPGQKYEIFFLPLPDVPLSSSPTGKC